MLSIVGLAPHFHACSDLPEVMTNPGLFASAIDVIGGSALAMVNHGKTIISKGYLS